MWAIGRAPREGEPVHAPPSGWHQASAGSTSPNTHTCTGTCVWSRHHHPAWEWGDEVDVRARIIDPGPSSWVGLPTCGPRGASENRYLAGPSQYARCVQQIARDVHFWCEPPFQVPTCEPPFHVPTCEPPRSDRRRTRQRTIRGGEAAVAATFAPAGCRARAPIDAGCGDPAGEPRPQPRPPRISPLLLGCDRSQQLGDIEVGHQRVMVGVALQLLDVPLAVLATGGAVHVQDLDALDGVGA
jgi:hypothetical protein